MKKLMLVLAAVAVLGGSSLALTGSTGAQEGSTAAFGQCETSECVPCPGCPCE